MKDYIVILILPLPVDIKVLLALKEAMEPIYGTDLKLIVSSKYITLAKEKENI